MVSMNKGDCLSNPDFAVICSFLQKYASILDIFNPSFKELQAIIERTDEVSKDLLDAMMKMLRKCRFVVFETCWERSLSTFCATYSIHDAEAVTLLGFENITTTMKLRVLKELCEFQFDHNTSFKWDVNRLTADEQRFQPIVEDCSGNMIWTMIDSNSDVTVYKEDSDQNSWKVLAHDRRELAIFVDNLRQGDKRCRKSERLSLNVDVNVLLDELCVAIRGVQ